MADWYGMSRTNYFKVKDPETFKKWLSQFEMVLFEKDGKFGFYSGSEKGDFPSGVYNEETDEYDDMDIAEKLPEFLADGEIAILMQAGAEKARYVSGFAIAVHSDGRIVQIVLDDIYERAAKEFGVPEKDISKVLY
jgi:hypothetical protein